MAIIPVNSGDNLQTKINSAAAGDILELEAGATFDGVFTLPNTGGMDAAHPITLRSARYSFLPTGRVSPADATNMSRVRTTSAGGNGAFITAANAGWWVLDGLEITDNAGINGINSLVDLAATNVGAHDITVTRCWIHQKETGVNYERSVLRAMQFEGIGLTYTRCYVDVIGSPYGTTEPHNSTGLLSVTGQDITMTNNYINFWWNGIFLGGGDTAPQHTATLTGGTTTSATFSNVTGLVDDETFVRFSVLGTATLSNQGTSPTLAQLTGDPWVANDGVTNGNYGDSMLVTSVADPTKFGVTRLLNFTTPAGVPTFTTTAASSSVAAVPNGAVNYILYQTAKVTNIAGSVITYDPQGTTHGIDYGVNSLNHPPASAAWCTGDEGIVVDVDVQKNTFNVDLDYAIYAQTHGRGCPKGGFEIKCVKRFTFKGNYITGYPSVLAFTAANQNGTAPWVIVDEVNCESNWIKPDTGYPACSRQAFLIADDAYLNTITPTNTVTLTNNLVTGGVREFADIKNGNIWSMTHNTSVNTQLSDNGPNALLSAQATGIPALTFTDNIGSVVCYGIKDYPAFWVSPVINHNVLVDADSGCSGGINVNTYGTNSALAPIPTAFSQVGFTNLAGEVYSLAPSSTYYHAGNGGLSPGVDWNALLLALDTGDVVTPLVMSGKTSLSGKVRLG